MLHTACKMNYSLFATLVCVGHVLQFGVCRMVGDPRVKASVSCKEREHKLDTPVYSWAASPNVHKFPRRSLVKVQKLLGQGSDEAPCTSGHCLPKKLHAWCATYVQKVSGRLGMCICAKVT